MKPEVVEYLQPILKALRSYHQHKVVGIEHVPAKGRVLLAVNHSLATYDISLLQAAIYEETGRFSRPLADRLFFKFPYVGSLVEAVGAKEGSQINAINLLNAEELVVVAPGGMKEALRPSSEKYKILWDNRIGFVRVALMTGTPVILGVCPRADDLFDVYPTNISKWVYERFRVPVFFAKGLAGTLVPRPIELTHYVSRPIHPPKPRKTPKAFEKQLAQFHEKVVTTAQKLMEKALSEVARKY